MALKLHYSCEIQWDHFGYIVVGIVTETGGHENRLHNSTSTHPRTRVVDANAEFCAVMNLNRVSSRLVSLCCLVCSGIFVPHPLDPPLLTGVVDANKEFCAVRKITSHSRSARRQILIHVCKYSSSIHPAISPLLSQVSLMPTRSSAQSWR